MSEEYTPPLEVAAGIMAGKYSISSVFVLTTQIEDLTRERDEARAEVERLRYVLRDTAEDLESDDPTPHKLLAGIIRKALEGAP